MTESRPSSNRPRIGGDDRASPANAVIERKGMSWSARPWASRSPTPTESYGLAHRDVYFASLTCQTKMQTLPAGQAAPFPRPAGSLNFPFAPVLNSNHFWGSNTP